ncbi:hypothetical protein SAPIO_CDS5701 [Scedosporium apiospermum]|uniref:Protein kinase domain-containing protein n=1 Tax=Pseudallescheria apiosperma TaxID=563466 RepID=A0A084G578_PSEDA|nr:uncharacterized protein SAPIO_CDS5701 [Scedosporium apiospermum]KEZ42490.1 hypothetical protein SAPIO_CDS5701 [Scedosporium apiospermum]
MEITRNPRLCLDGIRGMTPRGAVDEFVFFLQDEKNDPGTVAFDTARPASQRQNENASPLLSRNNETATVGQQQGPILDRSSIHISGLAKTPPSQNKLLPENLEVLGLGSSGYVYKCPRGFAYKVHVSQREVDLMKAAGDCSVAPLSRLVPAEKRKAIQEEMVSLVERLHSSEIGLVHGDIKPANFLRCRDGKLRLCDFDSARLIADEEAEGWEGFVSERYVAPSRGFPDYGPPTVGDDNYALAISVWELFTGKDALIDEDMEEVSKYGRAVDVDELEDDDIREFVRNRLRDGGAKV